MTSVPAPRPDTVAGQVRQMQVEVDRVATDLAAGAAAWEAGRARLDDLIQQQLSAERYADSQQQDSQVARARLNDTARRAYMNPVPQGWALAMSVDPNALTRSLENIKILQRLGVTEQGAVDLFTRDQTTNAQRVVRADALRRRAQAAQEVLDAQLTALRERADRAAADLRVAQQRLSDLRAAERRARDARQAALQRRTFVPGVYGSCSTPADGAYANGFLPPEMLCPLRTAAGQQLTPQAAAAFDRMSEFHTQTVGGPLCVTDSYRNYADQVAVFDQKPSLAATPGRSNHGWGLAVDLCGGAQSYGTPEYVWLKNNAAAFGFVHPAWAEPGGSKQEPWHWEFAG